MKKLIVAISLIVCGFFFSAAAARADSYATGNSNWYVSGSAGAYLRDDRDGAAFFSNGVTVGSGTQHETFDTGDVFNAALGYRFSNHFRLEGELGYANYQPSKVNPVSSAFVNLDGRSYNLASGGDTSRYTGTVNAYYDFLLNSFVTPYLGVGVGAGYDDTSRAVFSDGAGHNFIQQGGTSTNGIVLGEAGISIAVSDKISIVPAYRYYRYFGNNTGSSDESANIFKLGLRYSF